MFENLQHTFGVGNGKETACVNSLAYLLYAEQQGIPREDAMRDFTDTVSCICPIIRRLAIRINDRRAYWPDHDEANRWMHETAPRLLGTMGSVEVMRKRGFLCADAAVREIAPVWFDLAVEKWPEAADWAAELRACEPVVDTRTARAAHKIAERARKAAAAYAAADAAAVAVAHAVAHAAADAAAYAAADAAAVAVAHAVAHAYAYADADAAADAAAAAYADAHAYACAAADAAEITKPIMLALLDRCIAVKDEDTHGRDEETHS